MKEDEKILILRNVRRLILGRVKQPTNWELLSGIWGCGANTAYKTCVEINIDPYDTKTQTNKVNI